MLRIEVRKLHLRAFAVVVGKRPFPHFAVGKAPTLQFLYGLKVLPALSLRFLLIVLSLFALTTAGKQPALHGRLVHAELLGRAATAAVQKPVPARVVLRLGCGIENLFKIIRHRLSPSL